MLDLGDRMPKISIEAAKLFGVPFAWQRTVPHRFVRVPNGYVVQLYQPWGRWVVEPRITEDIIIKQYQYNGAPYLINEEDLDECAKTGAPKRYWQEGTDECEPTPR